MADLIDRQQAIDAIKSRKTAEQSSAGIMRNAVVDFCIDIVKKLPSAQPERKRGKWMVSYLEHEAMGIRPKLLYCSECCQCIAYSTNFCPNCGADMRGESK